MTGDISIVPDIFAAVASPAASTVPLMAPTTVQGSDRLRCLHLDVEPERCGRVTAALPRTGHRFDKVHRPVRHVTLCPSVCLWMPKTSSVYLTQQVRTRGSDRRAGPFFVVVSHRGGNSGGAAGVVESGGVWSRDRCV